MKEQKLHPHKTENPYDDACMVAPSPELQEKLKSRFDALTAGETEGPSTASRAKSATKKKTKDEGHLDAMLGQLLTIRETARAGLNDGLIIPGDYFPIGTPVRAVRNAAMDRAPLSGTVRIIVVLVNFKDKKMTAAHNNQHFKDLFFSTGVLPHGSVKEYFKEVTNNMINIDGAVVGPFNLSQNMSYYAHGASGMGGALPNGRTMAQEAAQLADPSVNFAPYDNDGNGFVDAFIVIHAGSGAEQTGSVNDIWSHKWVLPAQYNADSTKIYGYLTVPEDSRIGVCCHELGHLLFGFPDLYDTDYSSSGIGNWCLMAGGSWNGGGDIPAHPSAWCKANQGWVSTVVQSTNANVSVADVKTGRKVYRLWKDGTGGNEYFLVENRQRTLYDQHIPGDGLLIWHIDESISGNSNEIHPKVKLVQADNLGQLESGANRGDAGDAYPGSTHNVSFTDTSSPNSKSYAGVKTCVGVTNIGASGPTMSARFNVKCAITKIPKEFTKEIAKEFSKELTKEIKEFEKGPIKEIGEKGSFKEVEKPVTDKSAGFDKQPDKAGEKFSDKAFDKPTEGGFGGFGTFNPNNQPFINAELRPDLSRSALMGEDDYEELRGQMEIGSPGAKRFFDTKLPEV